MDEPKKGFQFRALISVLTTLFFIVMAFTGLMLFVTPPGRVAHWTNWKLLGLAKEQWGAMHICFCLLFIVLGIIHVYLNWKPLVSYFKSRATRHFALRAEWAIAVILTVAVGLGVYYKTMPFSNIMAFNEKMKFSWETTETRAPIPHAETLSLKELARTAGQDLDKLTANLKAKNIEFTSTDDIVGDIAQQNNMPPNELYNLAITEAHGSGGGRGFGSGGQGGGTGHGGPGWGMMALKDVCTAQSVDIEKALEKLKAEGIEATADMTLRQIADTASMNPHDILDMIRK